MCKLILNTLLTLVLCLVYFQISMSSALTCKVTTNNITTCVNRTNTECCHKRCYSYTGGNRYCSCGRELDACLSDKDCCNYAQLCTQGKCQCARAGTKCTGKKRKFCCSKKCTKGICECVGEKAACKTKDDCCGTAISCRNSTCAMCLKVNAQCAQPGDCCNGNCKSGQCKCNPLNATCLERSDCCPAKKGQRPIGCVRGFCKPCLSKSSEDRKEIQFGVLGSQCVGKTGGDACCSDSCEFRTCTKGGNGAFCDDEYDCFSAMCIGNSCRGNGCLPNGGACGDPGQDPCCDGECVQSLGDSKHKCK